MIHVYEGVSLSNLYRLQHLPEATSEILPEFSHTNSTSGTTQQELATAEGEFE